MTPDQKVQEKYRGNSTGLDSNLGPGKGKGQCPEEDKETDPTIIAGSDEDGQKDQEEEHTMRRRISSVSPQKKRKEICHIHTPQGHLPIPHLKTMTGKQKVSPDWSPQMRTKTP